MSAPLFHNMFHSIGADYDPMWSDVLMLVQAGGSAPGSVPKDHSRYQTPILRVGDPQVGAVGSGRFPDTSGIVTTTLPGVLRAAAPDDLFLLGPEGGRITSGRVFTLDGWYRYPARGSYNRDAFLFALGRASGGSVTGRVAQWISSIPNFTSTTASFVVGVPVGPSETNRIHVGVLGGYTYHDGWDNYTVGGRLAQSYSHSDKAAGDWVHLHMIVDFSTTAGALTVTLDGVPHATVPLIPATHNGYTTNSRVLRHCFGTVYEPELPTVWIGGLGETAGYDHGAPLAWHALRVTNGVRPYDAGMPGRRMWSLSGTPNNQGAGGSGNAVGQAVLPPGATFVVPGGVTQISAVCVGCKLSIAGTDVVAATWPVLGDGGGRGGTGGTGWSESVSPPPKVSFGGGGTPPPDIVYTYPGGGGGAGGYGGKGGDGFRHGAYNGTGQQGGGGGGASGQRGGHVGLKGRGANGMAPGSGPGTTGSPGGTAVGGGAGGTGAGDGVDGNHLAWRNAIPVTPGQTVLCTYIGQPGGTGAARIMWGDDRSYPDDAGDVTP